MPATKVHRIVAVAVAVPILLWALTGIIFLTKPGYGEAYETLLPKTHPMPGALSVKPKAHWNEVRLFRTILGDHLLVRQGNTWQHLDPATGKNKPYPSEKDIALLVGDAISANLARYGKISAYRNGAVTTDTGIEITLDWTRMGLTQQGRDTRLIDLLYKIHYLQWLGRKKPDKILGILGLFLLIALFGTGLGLLLGKKEKQRSGTGREGQR